MCASVCASVCVYVCLSVCVCACVFTRTCSIGPSVRLRQGVCWSLRHAARPPTCTHTHTRTRTHRWRRKEDALAGLLARCQPYVSCVRQSNVSRATWAEQHVSARPRGMSNDCGRSKDCEAVCVCVCVCVCASMRVFMCALNSLVRLLIHSDALVHTSLCQ